MKLIAVSGGADSMVLAHLYKNENVVLAFVNYNFRSDTWKDQQIVSNFAKKHNLKLEILDIKDNSYHGNFQNWARNIRYDFFQNIYKKYNCDQLLIAHHKDDFLETCIMQKQKNDKRLFYGIQQNNQFMSMNIYRPLLFKFWKHEIYKYAEKEKLEFNDDSTNFESKYLRNKVRNQLLSNCNQEEKNKMLQYFLNANQENQSKIIEIDAEFEKWKESAFDKNVFKKLKYQNDVVTKYINKQINVNLNKNIIKNIIAFISSNENLKKFKLSNNKKLTKINNKLIILR